VTRPIHPILRIRSAVARGSSSPVVAETRAGTFLVKLRGAAQGILPLISEIVVSELAVALGLSVPEWALLSLERGVPIEDWNDELGDLLARSLGVSLGVRFLESAAELRPGDVDRIDIDVASTVVWLDGLCENIDRTLRNPNLLLWRGQPWLIDHGAALSFHYDWANVDESTPRARSIDLRDHVLWPRAERLAEVDERCAKLCTRGLLERVLSEVPDEWLVDAHPGDSADRTRTAYVAYLWKRLAPPRPFLATAS
jgi:hypothetical protein